MQSHVRPHNPRSKNIAFATGVSQYAFRRTNPSDSYNRVAAATLRSASALD